MAKLQLTPDWMIGPKNAGKALVLWLLIAVAVIGAVWFVSQGARGAEARVANETFDVDERAKLDAASFYTYGLDYEQTVSVPDDFHCHHWARQHYPGV